MSSSSWKDEAQWIWVPDFDDNVDSGKFVLFRKVFHLRTANVPNGIIKVSGDTRYRLFVNGKSVSFGPCKSYPSRWYYETVDISTFLVEGENVLSAKVLRFSNNTAGNSSMMRAHIPGFFLHGTIDVSQFNPNIESFRSHFVFYRVRD